MNNTLKLKNKEGKPKWKIAKRSKIELNRGKEKIIRRKIRVISKFHADFFA
jgi:hypothetical protein